VAAVNPLLPAIAAAGFDGYWFGMDQAEVATDILFKSRADLERIHPDLVNAAITGFGATDVMRFLGQKPHHAFTGEVVIDSKKRPEGCRIKFRIRCNSVKLYDHLNVLRIETTMNHPAEFKILTSFENAEGKVVCRWCPMRKGVSNFWRRSPKSLTGRGLGVPHSRLIDALANAGGQLTASQPARYEAPKTACNASGLGRWLPSRPSPAVARVCRTSRLYPGDGLRTHERAPILGFGQPTRLAGPLARPLEGVRARLLVVPHAPRVRFERLTAIQALALRFSTHSAPRDRSSSRL
jgi:hypothetical protein